MNYPDCFDAWQSLPAAFFDKSDELADKPLLWAKRQDAWRPQSWSEVRDEVSALSRGLRGLGVAPGDRVVLVSENRPEWAIADLAIMSARALTVPAYTTNTVDDHVHVFTDCGARVVIVSTPQLAERVFAAARRAGGIAAIVTIEEVAANGGGIPVIGWNDLLARGRAAPDDVRDYAAALRRTDTCCLIYTSGTGGRPKGVMLSHGAILCNCMGAWHLFTDGDLLEVDREVFLSFLPLSHSYEHTAGLFFPLTIGAEIYYAESVEKLVADMAEARPTIMTAVPRLYESMHQRIVAGVARKGGLSAKLFRKAVELGIRRYEGRPLGVVDAIVDRLLDVLVRRKVAARFGGRLKAFVSGGAPLNYDIGVFFLALGVRLLQGYGQTETAPVVSANLPTKIRIDTVGPAFRGVEVRVADDGEILVRGELAMQGYWNQPEQTAETLRDGWVHTGDIGVVDADGYIRITDRKKDIIVVSGGDNVAPQKIEGALTFEPEIGQAMVYGDRRPHLVAVLVPDAEFARTLPAGKDLHPALQDAVDRANARLSPIEKVRRFIVADEPFGTENGLMTPSLKIRRHLIRDLYRDRLEALYGKQAAE
jgi:long-chain acyl-CoA synthetase